VIFVPDTEGRENKLTLETGSATRASATADVLPGEGP
jgi:hypothetical protein